VCVCGMRGKMFISALSYKRRGHKFANTCVHIKRNTKLHLQFYNPPQYAACETGKYEQSFNNSKRLQRRFQRSFGTLMIRLRGVCHVYVEGKWII